MIDDIDTRAGRFLKLEKLAQRREEASGEANR